MSGWANSKREFKYVTDKDNTNKAISYSAKILKSPITQINSNIIIDYNEILQGGCIYLPKFFCDKNDFMIFESLKKELDMSHVINWSKHHKFENPQISKTFNNIIDAMAMHFNVKIIQTRLNYYKDYTSYKPLHKDSHSYYTDENGNTLKENFTMGASFGFTRELEFMHEESKTKFSFPQNNGDIFAFNSQINDKFLHGVPKIQKNPHKHISDRISIIAWGIKN